MDILTLVIVTALGWCLCRASLCAVASTQEAIQQGRATGLYLQLLVVAGTALVLLGLTLYSGDVGRLPAEGATRLQVVLAAGVMAIGSMLNGGCYLGSIMYLGRGKANYLFSLVGIAAAARCNLPALLGIAALPGLRPQPGTEVLRVAVGASVVLGALALAGLRHENGHRLNARAGYALLAGILAGALMVLQPGWAYAGALNALGRAGLAPVMWPLVVSSLLLFAGAVAGGIAAGLWAPTGFTRVGVVRCLAGGFVLESAARCLPGGNDVLLMWVMPGLSAYGLLAYSVILSVLLLAWRVATQRRS